MPAETVPVKEAAEAKMDNEFAGKFPIKPAYLGKVGHAADMSWLTGPAYHLQADGDMWVVRYARDEEDPAGGLVVLDTALSLKSVHEGDLVSVYGNLRRDSSGMSQFRVPVYKADRVFLLERGNP